MGKYLKYALVSPSYKQLLYGLATTGATREALTKIDIENFEIKLPDIEVQTRIASVLSAYDDLIENNEKRIKALEEMAQLLYTEWFVKFEFPVNSPPLEGWQAKPDGVVYSPPEAGCLKGGVVSPRNTQNYMSLPYNPKLKERAKELRKAGNLSEVLFWQQVKNGQFKGFDFDRQKIIGNYIVDFYCSLPRQASPATPSKKGNNSPPVEGCPQGGVVIEIDGSSHDDKQDYDKERDIYLSSLGLTVVHILDSEVKKNLEGVMVWLNDHPAFQAPVQELPPRLSGTPPKEGNNSPSLKGWQAKPDGVVGYKDAGGKMVDSGTEYGMIPEGWEVKRFDADIELAYGKALKEENRIPGTILVCGSGGIVGTHNQKLVSGPGVVIGRKGNAGAVFWVNEDFYPIDTAFFVKTKLNLTFTFYLLKSQSFVLGDAAVPGLNREQAYRNQILVPPSNLINEFAQKVEPIRKLIGMIGNENNNLSQTRDLLIPQLVTGKRELK